MPSTSESPATRPMPFWAPVAYTTFFLGTALIFAIMSAALTVVAAEIARRRRLQGGDA